MNKKLHILFLCGWYPSRVLPTNGDFIYRHAKAVAKQHEVSVVHIITDANIQKTKINFQLIDGIKTYIGYVKPTKNPFIKAYHFYKTYFKIRKSIEKIDCIHLNEIYPFGLFCLIEKWFGKLPFLISEHSTKYQFQNSQNIGFIEKILSKLIVTKANFVCPVSLNLKESLQKIGLNGNFQIVENVVDTSLFLPIDKKENHFTIVHISNMVEEHKNVTGLLNVLSKIDIKIPNLSVILIGDNAVKYQAYLKNKSANSNAYTFINHIPHHQIVNYIQKADVFVLFSNYENLPCVILESFACGTPVISTDVGGIKECFPHDFGVLIKPKDEKKLENAILDFYKNKTTPDKKRMHTYVTNNFSEDAICLKFSSLYQTMISKNL